MNLGTFSVFRAIMIVREIKLKEYFYKLKKTVKNHYGASDI